MTRIEVVTVALYCDFWGIAISDKGNGKVIGRIMYVAERDGYDLVMCPPQSCGYPAPEGWLEGVCEVRGVYYTCQAAQDKEEGVEECLYQVLTALHSAGCMVRLQGLLDRNGDRETLIVHPGEAREKARLAAKAVSRG